MSSAAPAIKAATVGVLQGLFPPVDPADTSPALVSYGDSGAYLPDEIVAVTTMRSLATTPTMSAARPREEVTEVTVVFSVWSGAGPEVQQTITERAYAMLSAFADYFKTKPNETLGGACREAMVTSYELTLEGTTVDDSGTPTGRIAEVEAVLTAKARI